MKQLCRGDNGVATTAQRRDEEEAAATMQREICCANGARQQSDGSATKVWQKWRGQNGVATTARQQGAATTALRQRHGEHCALTCEGDTNLCCWGARVDVRAQGERLSTLRRSAAAECFNAAAEEAASCVMYDEHRATHAPMLADDLLNTAFGSKK
jgi:hypothetical protein